MISAVSAIWSTRCSGQRARPRRPRSAVDCASPSRCRPSCPRRRPRSSGSPRSRSRRYGVAKGVLRESMPRKGVELHWHDSDVSFLEGVMARGGREVADVIEAAWRDGARLRRVDRALQPRALAPRRSRRSGSIRRPSPTGSGPWTNHCRGITSRRAFRSAYLDSRAGAGLGAKTTPDCSFTGCTACDVCGDLGVDIVLGGAARG